MGVHGVRLSRRVRWCYRLAVLGIDCRRRWAGWLVDSGLRNPTRPVSALELGRVGEQLAARHLRRKGLKIVRRSVRDRLGEIDLIALDGRRVVFVEVKTRATKRHGSAVEAVDRIKQQRLHRAANFFLKRHHLWDASTRFDIVAVEWPPGVEFPHITHIENAFD